MVWQSDLKSPGRKNSVYIKKHTILQEDTCDLNEVEGSLLRFCLGLGVDRKQKRSWTGLGLLCLEALFLYFTKTIGWNVDLDLDDCSGETSGWESTAGGGLLLPLFFSISVFSFFLFVFFFLSEWGMFFFVFSFGLGFGWGLGFVGAWFWVRRSGLRCVAGLRFRSGRLLDWDDSKSWFLTDCVGSVRVWLWD